MRTILIVDDEPIIRQLFQTVLGQEGHTTLTATNGKDALRQMNGVKPDLILLDLMMPEMDGMTFLRLIRRNPDWKDIPVMVLSAIADRERIADAGALGVRDYLLKTGFSLAQLRARLAKYLPADPPSDKPAPRDIPVLVK